MDLVERVGRGSYKEWREGESVVGMYCMGEESIFNYKKFRKGKV